ncbi:MAG: glutathione peroxidase [Candidatus Kapaibacteriota bacterium]
MEQKSIYDFTVKSIDGKDVKMSDYKGKVLLIVNVASKCGFTPQYKGLEELYRKYQKDGLVVMGFPCNQFAGQEPGSNEEIKAFCKTNYDVTFPMFDKIDVNGDNTAPLYQYLKEQAPGILSTKDIKWNFTKFLIDKNGKVIERFAPATTPESIDEHIARLLKK